MRTIKNTFKYITTFTTILIILLIADIILIFTLSTANQSWQAYVPVEKISDNLTLDENGTFTFSDEGKTILSNYNAFAMYIDENGDVKWDYDLPNDIPKHYSIQQVATFTKWYLNDYPIYVGKKYKGLFVVGCPKNSIWKYTIEYSIDALKAYINYIPIMIIANLIIIFTVPFIVIKRQSYNREKQRTEWIAGISHDIRTPLALVLGNASAIKAETCDTNNEIAQKAAKIEKEVLAISTKIANLNMENKLTYGMGKWNKETIPLCPFIRDTLCDIINSGVGEQYDFDINIDETMETASIKGDKELIKRLIENLIYNSINHNPKGCKITVTLTHYKKNRSILTIKDNGCGVTKEQLKNFKASLFKSTQIPEHGLGIRLVRQIASVHGWKAKFFTPLEGGFGCTITLPVIQ
jgi:nitrogen-specific signal transduction histidine kinase